MTREIKLLQRKLRNKKKGSNNRAKINHKIARLHQRITDTRKDFHYTSMGMQKNRYLFCQGR
ncbi:MAG: hypothetical protein QNJ70_13660 [Xenococcaceae cyanobacterium MO_207.B15]|nr:hypothetical protein [Xenococcaceae cyanobacterium MO_207.B15]